MGVGGHAALTCLWPVHDLYCLHRADEDFECKSARRRGESRVWMGPSRRYSGRC